MCVYEFIIPTCLETLNQSILGGHLSVEHYYRPEQIKNISLFDQKVTHLGSRLPLMQVPFNHFISQTENFFRIFPTR